MPRCLAGKIALVRIAILAEQYDTFRDYRTDDLPSFFLHTPQARYYNKTRIEVGDVAVMQLSGGRTFVRGAGWQFTIHRRRLMKPVVEGSADAVAPSAGWTRLHWFLDTKFDVLDNNPTLVATHGRSTIGTIAPHGIIGQSFDGSMIAVNGKLDDYGDGPEFTTSARGGGRHRGARPPTTSCLRPSRRTFASRRFSAISPVAPRNVRPARGRQSTRRHVSLGGFDTALRRGHGAGHDARSSLLLRTAASGGVHVPAATAAAGAAAAAATGTVRDRRPRQRQSPGVDVPDDVRDRHVRVTQKANMIDARKNFAICALNERIYVAGGKSRELGLGRRLRQGRVLRADVQHVDGLA